MKALGVPGPFSAVAGYQISKSGSKKYAADTVTLRPSPLHPYLKVRFDKMTFGKPSIFRSLGRVGSNTDVTRM